MDYASVYKRIIAQYGEDVKSPNTEKHHILPVSMGGTDHHLNLTYVTPRVHFILHQLLYRMTSGEDKRKMYYAVLLMGQSRNIKTGAHYELLREQQGARQTQRMMGNVPWNKGKKGYKLNTDRSGRQWGPSWRVRYKGVVYDSVKECREVTGATYYSVRKYGEYLERVNPQRNTPS